MKSQKLVKTALIILVAINFCQLVLSCQTAIPVHYPYLNKPSAQNLCARYKLVDQAKLQYAFDSWQPCADTLGGYCLPPGQFESVLAAIRQEQNNCSK